MVSKALLATLLSGALFSWGYLSSRTGVFPHSQIQAIAARAGLGDTVAVTPRSDQLSLLRSLPYVQSSFDHNASQTGVLIYDESKAFKGYTFWNSSFRNSATLMDMDGGTVHEWHRDLGDAGWHHAELLPSGEILVVVEDHSITKLDFQSEIIWQYSTRAHHDLSVASDGSIYLLSRNVEIRPAVHPTVATAADKIVVLDKKGSLIKELSLLDIIQASPYSFLLPRVRSMVFEDHTSALDILHANHVEVFDGGQASLSPLYERGNLLLSFKHLNAIAIVEMQSQEVLWLWGPTNIALQHNPVLLNNGNILLFDNGLNQSRVLELNPLKLQIPWQYRGKGLSRSFYSSWGGANQRLPNGNTLITETSTGYGIEVTREGEIVWQFANPDLDQEGKRMNIWRMTRLSGSELDFL